MAHDPEDEVKIEFFVSSKIGKHKNIGQVHFTPNEVKSNPNQSLSLTKQKEAKLNFTVCKFQNKNSFLNYIFGGCEINLAIAVDFTMSNGDPKSSDSLHTNNLNKNQYHQVLKSVGDILQFYDEDKQFPCFGFGAKLKNGGIPSTKASHCFAMNGNIFDPECDGLDGVLDAYKNSL